MRFCVSREHGWLGGSGRARTTGRPGDRRSIGSRGARAPPRRRLAAPGSSMERAQEKLPRRIDQAFARGEMPTTRDPPFRFASSKQRSAPDPAPSLQAPASSDLRRPPGSSREGNAWQRCPPFTAASSRRRGLTGCRERSAPQGGGPAHPKHHAPATREPSPPPRPG